MQLSSDILFFIGQNYLQDTLYTKKLFYHFEDDELQKILFGEVLYKHKQYPKTTLPLDFILPDRNNNYWIYEKTKYRLNRYVFNHLDLTMEMHSKANKDEYKMFITFEKILKKGLSIKIEYICYNGYDNEPVIYSDEFISYSIDNKELKIYSPHVHKILIKTIYKKIIN